MISTATITAQGPEISARDELRLKVLRALEADPELSQRQLPAELGVSFGGVNYALKALTERGFVKADNFRKSGNKVAYLYVLTPKGVAGDGVFGPKTRGIRVVEARDRGPEGRGRVG